jgi:hypothetical protein
MIDPNDPDTRQFVVVLRVNMTPETTDHQLNSGLVEWLGNEIRKIYKNLLKDDYIREGSATLYGHDILAELRVDYEVNRIKIVEPNKVVEL